MSNELDPNWKEAGVTINAWLLLSMLSDGICKENTDGLQKWADWFIQSLDLRNCLPRTPEPGEKEFLEIAPTPLPPDTHDPPPPRPRPAKTQVINIHMPGKTTTAVMRDDDGRIIGSEAVHGKPEIVTHVVDQL